MAKRKENFDSLVVSGLELFRALTPKKQRPRYDHSDQSFLVDRAVQNGTYFSSLPLDSLRLIARFVEGPDQCASFTSWMENFLESRYRALERADFGSLSKILSDLRSGLPSAMDEDPDLFRQWLFHAKGRANFALWDSFLVWSNRPRVIAISHVVLKEGAWVGAIRMTSAITDILGVSMDRMYFASSRESSFPLNTYDGEDVVVVVRPESASWLVQLLTWGFKEVKGRMVLYMPRILCFILTERASACWGILADEVITLEEDRSSRDYYFHAMHCVGKQKLFCFPVPRLQQHGCQGGSSGLLVQAISLATPGVANCACWDTSSKCQQVATWCGTSGLASGV